MDDIDHVVAAPVPAMAMATAPADAGADAADGALAMVPSAPGSGGQAENIAVCIRVRPLNDRELRHKDASVLRTVNAMNLISVTDAEGQPLPGKHNVFQYDHIFDARATTRAMYDRVAQRIVRSTLDGINGTIFAYGQTSSGKTYTMTGDGDGGILQLAVEDIFAYIEQSTDRDFLLRVSFVEIYNEVVKDLLNPTDKGHNLKLREDPRKGVYVECKEEIITNYEDILTLLELGNQRRTVGQTAMNERSSRSHSIFRIVIESKEKSAELSRRQSEDDMQGAVLVACLSLVDLAGSESVRHTAAEGLRQREAGNINKSLLTLSRVINTLAGSSASRQNAPFRDSKLTRLLQNSLDGNTRTLIICCVTPSERYLEETKSTLQFAARAKTIQTSAHVNEILDDQAQLKRLKREVHELKKILKGDAAYHALKAENEALQNEQNKNKAEITRLLGLILSSNSVRGLTASTRKARPHRAKRTRETWCPGDFPAHAVGVKPLVSPNPQPRKRNNDNTPAKENINPQNLLSALDDADGDDDEDGIGRNKYSRRGHQCDDVHMDSSQLDSAALQFLMLLRQVVRKQQLDVLPEDPADDDRGVTDVEELKSQVASAIQAIDDAFSSSRNAVRGLVGEKEALHMEIEELQSRLERTTFDASATASILQERDEEAEKLRSNVAALTEEIQTLTAMRNDDELRSELSKMTEKFIALNSKYEALLLAEEDTQRANEDLMLELEVSSKSSDELTAQLEKAFVEIEETKLLKEEVEEELVTKSAELEQRVAEFADREAELLEKIAALHTSDNSKETSSGCAILTAENDKLMAERSTLTETIAVLEEQLQSVDKSRCDLEAQIKILVDENGSNECKTQALVAEIESLRQELQESTKRLHTAEANLNAAQTREERARQSIRELEEIAEDLKTRLNLVERDSHSLRAALDDKAKELCQLEAAESEAKAYKEFLQAEMDETSQKMAALECENGTLRDQLAALKQEVELALVQQKEQTSFPDEVVQEIDQLQAALETLQSELESKSRREQQWTADEERLKNEISDLHQEVSSQRAEINRQQEILQTLEEEKSAKRVQESGAASEEVASELARMREERWSLAAKLEESEGSLSRARLELQRLSNDQDVNQTAATEQIRRLEAEIEHSRAERDALAKTANDLEESLHIHKQTVETLVEEQKCKNSESTRAKEEFEELQSKFVEVNAQLSASAQDLIDAQETLHQAVRDKNELMEQLQVLERQLMNLSEEKLALQSELDSHAEETKCHSRELESMHSEVQHTRAELASTVDQLSALRTEQARWERQAYEQNELLTKLRADVEKVTEHNEALIADQSQNSNSQGALTADLESVRLELESERKLRSRLELDVSSYSETMEVLRSQQKEKAVALQSLQDKLQESVDSRDRLENEATRLRTELQRANEEMAELRVQHQQWIARSEEKQLALQETVADLETKLASALESTAKVDADTQSQVAGLQQKLSTSLEEQKRLESLNEAGNIRERDLQSEITKLKSDLDTARADLLQLKQRADLREEHWHRREEELSKAAFENNNLREQCHEAQEELEAYQKYADEEIHKLRVSVEQSDTEMLEMNRASKQREDQLRVEIHARQEKIHAQQEEIASLQQQVEQTRERIVSAEAEVESIRAENSKNSSDNANVERLQVELEDITARYTQVIAEQREEKVRFEEMKAEKEKVEGTAYEHRNAVEELSESLKSAQMEAIHYHNQLVEAQLKKEEVEQLVETQKKRIEKLEKVKMTTETLDLFRKLKSDRHDLQKQVQRLQEDLKVSQASKAESRDVAEQQHTRMLRLKDEEVRMLKKHIEELGHALQAEKNKTSNIRAELKSLADDVMGKAQQEIVDMQAVMKERNEQVLELEAKLAVLEKENEALAKSKSSKESYLEKENLDLLIENRKLKKRLEGRAVASSSVARVDDEVAAFEASARAASEVLAEPPTSSRYVTHDLGPLSSGGDSGAVGGANVQENMLKQLAPTPTSARKFGGISSFLLSTGDGADGNSDAADEEARPACSQQ